MKKFLIVAFLAACSLQGQQVVSYTPTVKGATIGTLNCTFYFQYPLAGQFQAFCTKTDTNKTVHNSIEDLNVVFSGAASANVDQVGAVTWTFYSAPSISPTAITFHICVSSATVGVPVAVLDGTF